MVLFSEQEARPLRVRESVVVEQVVSRAAPDEACIREAAREEAAIPLASSSVVGRVVGGFLSDTGHKVTLLIGIGVSAVTIPVRIRSFLGGVFIG